MKKTLIALVAMALSAFATAQIMPADMLDGQSCTSIMVGKKASADGSVMTSHTCDSRYRTWMSIEPAENHPAGATQKIYRGTMHNYYRGDTTGIRYHGEIPEVAHTYAYLNTSYPCLNEHQLAIGESTFGGPDTLQNTDNMFMIEDLERIALQRCTTARAAILTIGELIRQYGYADAGECITIADRNEVWQMEIIGAGRKEKGGVWVAQRVPDDAVAVSCNIPRIGKLRRGSDDFLCSDNVEQVAKRHKLWDGKGEFVFWKAYNCDYAKGRNFLEREYHILSTLAPSLNLSWDAHELPFCVVPERKVSAQDVMYLLRATYDGTEFDMCKNLRMVVDRKDSAGNAYKDTVASPVANPWMGGNMMKTLNYLKPGAVEFHRGVSVAWCSYSFVAQLRDWLPDEVGGVCWMACDNPAQSPRIPIFCGNTRLPRAFGVCGHKGFNEQAWLWQYRKANKLATVAWQSTRKLMTDAILKHEEKAFSALPYLESQVASLKAMGHSDEAVANLLNDYTFKVYDETAATWRDLEHRLWERFGFGF